MRKNIIILLFTIPAIMLFHSCKENTYTTTAYGIVIDGYSRQPIDGVKVSIQDGLGPAGLEWNESNAKYFPKKAITYTDSTGHFSLSLKDHENPPLLGAGKDGYGDFYIEGSGWGAELKGLKYGKNSNLVIVGYPLKNPNEGFVFKALTFIAIEKSDSVTVCSSCFSYSCRKLSNPIENVKFYVLENEYFEYTISYYRNNEWNLKKDRVFISDLEAPVEIYY